MRVLLGGREERGKTDMSERSVTSVFLILCKQEVLEARRGGFDVPLGSMAGCLWVTKLEQTLLMCAHFWFFCVSRCCVRLEACVPLQLCGLTLNDLIL